MQTDQPPLEPVQQYQPHYSRLLIIGGVAIIILLVAGTVMWKMRRSRAANKEDVSDTLNSEALGQKALHGQEYADDMEDALRDDPYWTPINEL